MFASLATLARSLSHSQLKIYYETLKTKYWFLRKKNELLVIVNRINETISGSLSSPRVYVCVCACYTCVVCVCMYICLDVHMFGYARSSLHCQLKHTI